MGSFGLRPVDKDKGVKLHINIVPDGLRNTSGPYVSEKK